MVEEVISNLVSNSIKYSSAGSNILVSIIENDTQVTILVSDRGIGIPDIDKNKIFEAFQRASNVENIHGTGLGLSISKQFIEQHGGTITFQSKVGEGTTFTVVLPKQH